MAQTNALLIFVPGLFKYHQRQSLKGSSLNPGLSAFQSKCLDCYKFFVSLSKNVLKAHSSKSKKLLQRDVYVFLHMLSNALQPEKNTEIQEKHQKTFQSIKSFQPGINGK